MKHQRVIFILMFIWTSVIGIVANGQERHHEGRIWTLGKVANIRLQKIQQRRQDRFSDIQNLNRKIQLQNRDEFFDIRRRNDAVQIKISNQGSVSGAANKRIIPNVLHSYQRKMSIHSQQTSHTFMQQMNQVSRNQQMLYRQYRRSQEILYAMQMSDRFARQQIMSNNWQHSFQTNLMSFNAHNNWQHSFQTNLERWSWRQQSIQDEAWRRTRDLQDWAMTRRHETLKLNAVLNDMSYLGGRQQYLQKLTRDLGRMAATELYNTMSPNPISELSNNWINNRTGGRWTAFTTLHSVHNGINNNIWRTATIRSFQVPGANPFRRLTPLR